jgi:hypothetical protein
VSRRTALLFGVHAHQPAGNFEHVFERARDRCYRPFLETMERHPDAAFTFHASGTLLEWWEERHPDDIALLRTLVRRGQAEVLGGGDTEPILSSIPHRDRRTQLHALSDRVRRLFGTIPSGAWIAERVWEPALVAALTEEGIAYVPLDDHHFRRAGVPREERLDGYYTTEYGGARLDIFPIARALRYRIPFARAEEAVEQILESGRVAIYFDDIEKFGLWPQTYEWVYERGWLEAFLHAASASGRITFMTYETFRRQHASNGLVYLPTASYPEMEEWSGGVWHNFLRRYSEANWMHKRMLDLSTRLDRLPADRRTPAMRSALHRAQANDAYWHGIFGGLYLPHLRRSIHASILALEAMLDVVDDRPPSLRRDLDCDGADELLLHDRSLQIALRDDGRAAIHELGAYAIPHDFADTLASRREPYHSPDGELERRSTDPPPAEGIVSIHDREPVAAVPHYVDSEPRASFVDAVDTGAGNAAVRYRVVSTEDGARLHLRGEAEGCEIMKHYTIRNGVLTVDYDLARPATLRTRCDLAFAAVDAPAARTIAHNGDVAEEIPGGRRADWEGLATEIAFHDDVLRAALVCSFVPAAAIRIAPHVTLSRSEDGFETIVQSVTLEIGWSQATQASVRIRITRTGDGESTTTA